MLRAVVLVEGNSDRVALLTLAGRRGRDLAAEGIEVVAMDGITNTRAFASRYGPHGLGVPLAGLYDAAEEAKLRKGLAAAGLETALEPDGPMRLGLLPVFGRPGGRADPRPRRRGRRGRHRGRGRGTVATAPGRHARPA